MIKKILDVVSLASIAIIAGAAIWPEGPHAPGHLSMQSKIIVWVGAPFAFSFSWLIIRYANAAVERFPRVFGQRGLLFYSSLFVGGFALLEYWFPIVRKLILSKLAAG